MEQLKIKNKKYRIKTTLKRIKFLLDCLGQLKQPREFKRENLNYKKIRGINGMIKTQTHRDCINALLELGLIEKSISNNYNTRYCTKYKVHVDKIVQLLDVIEENYNLYISSPGLYRILQCKTTLKTNKSFLAGYIERANMVSTNKKKDDKEYIVNELGEVTFLNNQVTQTTI